MIETIDLLGCDCCTAEIVCCCLRTPYGALPPYVTVEILGGDEDECCVGAKGPCQVTSQGGSVQDCGFLNTLNYDCGPSTGTARFAVSFDYDATEETCTVTVDWIQVFTGGAPYRHEYFRRVYDSDAFCGKTFDLPLYGWNFSPFDPINTYEDNPGGYPSSCNVTTARVTVP